jgi:hypothetical protein
MRRDPIFHRGRERNNIIYCSRGLQDISNTLRNKKNCNLKVLILLQREKSNKCKVQPITDKEGPEWEQIIALFFL